MWRVLQLYLGVIRIRAWHKIAQLLFPLRRSYRCRQNVDKIQFFRHFLNRGTELSFAD